MSEEPRTQGSYQGGKINAANALKKLYGELAIQTN